MKTLKIAALAVCLNIPMAHADDQISAECTHGQLVAATAVYTAALTGLVEAALHFIAPRNLSSARILKYAGSTIAIAGASHAAFNTLGCPKAPINDTPLPAIITTVGLSLIAAGSYLEKK